MTIDKHLEIMEELFNKCKETAKGKGTAYSSDDDTLCHFKDTANFAGLTKYQVWLVFFRKHISAIMNAIKRNPNFPDEVTEGIDGRLEDALIYLTLFKSLLTEDQESHI